MASEARPPPRFFVITEDMDSSHDTSFERMGGTIGEAPRCPHCGAFIGMRAWLPPLRGKLMLYGEGFGDFVEVPGGGYLVSARFAEAFLAERLTGIPDFQPVTIVRVSSRRKSLKSATPPAYFYFNPVFGGAAVDEARSRIRREKPISCDWCRETNVDTIHGFSLEEGSWRGEDIFDARGLPGSAVVSERFARFVERHRLTNLRLIPTEEYTWDPLERGPPSPVH